jgi:adenylate kinase
MNNGSLVPDKLVIDMIMERIKQQDALEGFLLDGFPRTLPQAQVLDEALCASNNQLDAVLVLQVPDDIIIERTSGRRIDPQTGNIYHIKFNPPPQDITGRVIQRDDDHEMIVRKRLEKYRSDTGKVLPYYEAKGLVRKISGLGSVDGVADKISHALEPGYK